ncbi:hypothetical protein AAHB50_28850 [Bacillus toyonensis]
MNKLGEKEVYSVVSYIGVNNGYLGDFSYASHADFYPRYCGLAINPNDYPGTTRERFIQILGNCSPEDQAKILKGVLERCPLSSFEDSFEDGYLKKFDFEKRKNYMKKLLNGLMSYKVKG